MFKRIIPIIFACFLCLAFSASAGEYNLSDYPKPFIEDNRFNGLIVVGDYAHAKDVLGAIDIIAALQFQSAYKISLASVLASQIEGSETKQNLILVGGPCINAVVYKFMDKPFNCSEGFSEGIAKIKLFGPFETGKYALMVAGLTADDTYRGSLVLANHKDYNFTGKDMDVGLYAKTFTVIE